MRHALSIRASAVASTIRSAALAVVIAVQSCDCGADQPNDWQTSESSEVDGGPRAGDLPSGTDQVGLDDELHGCAAGCSGADRCLAGICTAPCDLECSSDEVCVRDRATDRCEPLLHCSNSPGRNDEDGGCQFTFDSCPNGSRYDLRCEPQGDGDVECECRVKGEAVSTFRWAQHVCWCDTIKVMNLQCGFSLRPTRWCNPPF